jgi:hypothetical protein
MANAQYPPFELSARVKGKGHNEEVSDIDAREYDKHFEQQQTVACKERFPFQHQKQINQINSFHFVPFHPAMQRGRGRE